jgi:hypothetical protein
MGVDFRMMLSPYIKLGEVGIVLIFKSYPGIWFVFHIF